MSQIRRSGYVLVTRKGDRSPRHAHVLRDGRLIVKWDLERGRPMQGVASAKLVALIRELEEEGLL